MDNNLKRYRRMLKLTQDELAEGLDVTRQTINAIELGKHDPSLRLALRLAKLFNCKIEELFVVKSEFEV